MQEYTTLQQGSSGQDVMELQKGYIKLGYLQEGEDDGIFGPKTANATIRFQKDQGIAQDGIAGKETWGKMNAALLNIGSTNTGNADTAVEVPEVPQVEAPSVPQPPTPVEQARQDMEAIRQEGIRVNQAYEEKLQNLYDQITGMPAFSYNVNEDALFAQYADAYQRGGVLAMQDAMGQAAALTGGYGSSYGQSVGQQAHQQYMAGLANVIPTLESRAYDRYRQGREDQLAQYGLVWQQANDEYSKYMDRLQQQWQELDYVQGREDLAWQREQAQRQEDYSRLMSYLSAGYKPTDAELAAAGMTREQADAILKSYNASQTRYSGSGGGGKASTTSAVSSESGFTGTTYREAILFLEDNDAIGLGWEELMPEYKWKLARAAYAETGEGDGTRVAAHNNYTDYVRSFVEDKMAMQANQLKQEQFRGSTYNEAQAFLKEKGIQADVITKEQWERERSEYIRTGTGSEYVREHSNYKEYLQYYIAYVVSMYS